MFIKRIWYWRSLALQKRIFAACVKRHICGWLCSSVNFIALFSVYRIQEIFGRGKFWRTMQVTTIGEEKFGEKLQSVHISLYVFRVSVNIGKENFDKSSWFAKFANFSPTKFSRLWYHKKYSQSWKYLGNFITPSWKTGYLQSVLTLAWSINITSIYALIVVKYW